MRIGGLASGIDTDSIIRDMMQANRIPLNKITQKKQYLEWQLDSYRDVNKDVRSMRDGLLNMTLQSTYMAKTVSVSDEKAVSIRALSAESEFSGTLQIHQLATAATWQSAEKKDLSKDSKASEIFTFGNNEDEITLNITAPDGSGNNVASPDIKIGKDESIESVISKINKSDAGINAFFDEFTGKIALTAKNSGEGNIKVEVNNTEMVADINGNKAGQNADFTFNGLRTERASNTFTINGFEITLKEVTSSAVTFNSATDTDKVFDSVKQFVDDYNKLIKDLNAQIREPKYRDYQPLSAEEKADMKESEIELWEEKAMSGTLKNDPTIQRLLSDMRMALTKGVEGPDGKTINLSSLGITTSKDYMSNGVLEIDEDKLREAISENPNGVYELLGKNNDDPKQRGIIHDVRDAMKVANDTISARAGNAGSGKDSFTLGRNLKEMDSQIERFQERLKKTEDRLWRQFSAMEQAMNRANAQAAQLMNGLGGM